MVEQKRLPNLYENTPKTLKPIVGVLVESDGDKLTKDFCEMGFRATSGRKPIDVLNNLFTDAVIADTPLQTSNFKEKAPSTIPVIGLSSDNNASLLFGAGADFVLPSTITPENLGRFTSAILVERLRTPDRVVVKTPSDYYIEPELSLIFKMVNGKREYFQEEKINTRVLSTLLMNYGEIVSREDLRYKSSLGDKDLSSDGLDYAILNIRAYFGKDSVRFEKNKGYSLKFQDK